MPALSRNSARGAIRGLLWLGREEALLFLKKKKQKNFIR
jgi:hypothetical protein